MIAIIDYEMGNLRSVQKAFERVGAEATVTGDPNVVAEAEKIVLPGVGAFRDAIAALKDRGLVEPIRESVAKEKPVLGICLGMQLFFDRSYEYGEYEGLGLLPGEVRRFDLPHDFKVPHMGWNEGRFKHASPLAAGIAEGSHYYFVHSYYACPADESVTLIESDYGGPFCAAVQRGRLFATQFHPEKSQSVGLKLLENFAKLA
jgi:glutamine amidotransferase